MLSYAVPMFSLPSMGRCLGVFIKHELAIYEVEYA